MEEDDEQAQPEKGDSKEPVPVPEPEPVPPRCGRHPSQLRTGVCSSCLMERLSSVRGGDQPESEIVEVAAAAAEAPAECSGATADADRGRLRNTLMLLFQLDDSATTGASEGPRSSAAAEFQSGSGRGRDRDRGGKLRKGPGSWLRSIRALRWRRNGAAAASAMEPSPSLPPRRGVAAVDPSATNGGGAQVERRLSFRRSCEWMAYPSRGAAAASSLDPPRHSWDGSMVGRALACSFACLEEQEEDGARRVRRSNAEEARAVAAAESRSGSGRSDLAAEAGGDGRRLSFRGRSSCDAAGVEMAAVSGGVGRRRSNRWSRVWDRSITSPLKEFVRKGEHVLERSLSESRREVRRGKNAEAADISGEIHQPGRHGHVPGRASQGTIRSSLAANNGDVQSFRTDWLKNSKIGRSRSVHYTSPGNLDNGMLRFYLTPMRSSRTANRGRRRSSRLFARGLFSFI